MQSRRIDILRLKSPKRLPTVTRPIQNSTLEIELDFDVVGIAQKNLPAGAI